MKITKITTNRYFSDFVYRFSGSIVVSFNFSTKLSVTSDAFLTLERRPEYHGIKKTRYDRCLRPPSRIEPSMRVKLKSKRRSPVCIQLISCTVLKREICCVLCLIFTAECKYGMIGCKNSPIFAIFF